MALSHDACTGGDGAMSNHYLKMVLDDGFQGPHVEFECKADRFAVCRRRPLDESKEEEWTSEDELDGGGHACWIAEWIEAVDMSECFAVEPSVPEVIAEVPIEVSVRPIEPQGKLIGFASVNIGGIVIDDFKVVNGKNGIFLGEPSKPDPTTRTGYRSTARVMDRHLQERLDAAAAQGYTQAVEKLIARAEALRPAPIKEQMAKAAKEAGKENAARPTPAKGKEARDDR